MKNRIFTVILLLVLLVTLTSNARATYSSPPEQKSLIYVELGSAGADGSFASTGLPRYAWLEGGLLTGADRAGEQALKAAGLTYQVVDSNLGSGSYYLAETHTGRPAPNFAAYGQVLLTLSNSTLLRMDPRQVEALTAAGAELQRITLDPKPLSSTQVDQIIPEVVNPDPVIQGIIDQVITGQIYQYDRELAGELPVWVDGAWYTIPTRNTNSGTPIQKTTHYAGQTMAADLGAENIEYHVWNNDTNPNVIGEIPGLVNPNDIYIIGAHIDDVSGTPGADDNASGSVATLIAADLFSQYQWGCTLRFALWTGEEQGLNGSYAYAQRSYNRGENIVGYLNLDMIAWNTIGSDPVISLFYSNSVPPSYQFAQLFADVVDAYNINLNPVLDTGQGGSDHTSFLEFGYNSILAIEDDSTGDFNPYYHGPGDTPNHTDPAYFTNFVKASLATFAHLSGCLIADGVGSLDGHVTAAEGGAPIAGADVVAEDSSGYVFPTTTDETGYYTRTLLAGTYTVTASAFGFLPATVSGVQVLTDTTTTLDLALLSAPTHVVSGTISEVGTGVPLVGEVSFLGTPVSVWSDPAGHYQAVLPEGSYTMRVRADLHRPEQRDILLDHDQTQDFALEPLPCVLLVDDDQNNPDLRDHYTSALDGLGVGYDVWDVSVQGDPAAIDLIGYSKVLWYTGGPSSSTFTSSNEASVAAYLDAGGRFFLTSHEYLYDMGLTDFGRNYLHIGTYNDDVHQATVTGQNYFSGLGPYALAYHFTDWSDIVNPDASAQVAFHGNNGNAAISYDGTDFKSIFFAYPFDAINLLADRQAVMQRILDFFGSCEPQIGWLDGTVTDATNQAPLANVTIAADEFQTLTNQDGYYTMTLQAGTYLVTATLDGYTPQSYTKTIYTGVTTTQDFALQPIVCEPVTQADFTWSPINPVTDELVTFSGTANGSEPITYDWDFGDGATGSGSTATHSYATSGDYLVTLTASNECGQSVSQHTVTVAEACTPITHSDFTWLPIDPVTGEAVTFNGNSDGSQPISYNWLFGDGYSGEGITVTHTYNNAGNFNAILTVTNACGEGSAEHIITVAPACDPVTQASFAWDPLLPISGEVITFTGSSNGSGPVTLDWDFGDGSIGTGSVLTHTFSTGGDYLVSLTASNGCGQATVTSTVTVAAACEPASEAAFTWLPLDPVNGEEVFFAGSSAGTEPITYTWGFGDGSSGEGITTTHTFVDPGIYSVTLTTTNACGESSTMHTVTVAQACQPVDLINFTWLPLEPMNGDLVSFDVTYSGTGPVDFSWDFGDGGTGSGASTSHTFASTGMFTVELSASNACGDDLLSKEITILQKLWSFFLPVIVR